jgi:hypothetical protein
MLSIFFVIYFTNNILIYDGRDKISNIEAYLIQGDFAICILQIFIIP